MKRIYNIVILLGCLFATSFGQRIWDMFRLNGNTIETVEGKHLTLESVEGMSAAVLGFVVYSDSGLVFVTPRGAAQAARDTMLAHAQDISSCLTNYYVYQNLLGSFAAGPHIDSVGRPVAGANITVTKVPGTSAWMVSAIGGASSLEPYEGFFVGYAKSSKIRIPDAHSYDRYTVTPYAVANTDSITYPLMVRPDTNEVLILRKGAEGCIENLGYSIIRQAGTQSPVTGVEVTAISSDTLIVSWTLPAVTRNLDSIIVCWSSVAYVDNPNSVANASKHNVLKTLSVDTIGGLPANTKQYINIFPRTISGELGSNVVGARDTCTTEAASVTAPYFNTFTYSGNADPGDNAIRYLATGIGNGTANRTAMVIIKPYSASRHSIIKISTMGGDTVCEATTQAAVKTGYLTFTNDSIRISNDTLNRVGIPYEVMVWGSLDGYVKAGEILGDGNVDHHIDVGFTPDIVFAKNRAGSHTAFRTLDFSDDTSTTLGETALYGTRIRSFISTPVLGFDLGNVQINTTGGRGWYLAIKLVAGYSWTGTYTGNGSGTPTNRAISAVTTAQPDYVMVATENTYGKVYRTVNSAVSIYPFADSGTQNIMPSLDATGFSVVGAGALNTSGIRCYWYAQKINLP